MLKWGVLVVVGVVVTRAAKSAAEIAEEEGEDVGGSLKDGMSDGKAAKSILSQENLEKEEGGISSYVECH